LNLLTRTSAENCTLRPREEFTRFLLDAQHTLNQTLSIPKNVADAANQLLKIAHDEYIQVLFHPDPDEFSRLAEDFFAHGPRGCHSSIRKQVR
jgi:Rad3-related DNA helicase